MALIQAALVDRSEADDVNKLNDILKIYREHIDPSIKIERKKFEKSASQSMDELFKSFENFTKEMSGGRRSN